MSQFLILLTSFVLFSTAIAQEKLGGRDHDERRSGPPRPDEFFKVYDVDNDKKVSQSEFGAGERAARLSPEIREKIFSRLDKDSDGFISLQEMRSMAPKKRHNPLEKADLNKDGRISKEEFAGHVPFAKVPADKREKMFARFDRNSDGFLDRKDGRPDGWMAGRGDRHLPRVKVSDLDRDGNGSLSWGEFRAAPSVISFSEDERRKAFDKMDLDGDGEISSKEARTPQGHADKKSRSKK